MSAGELARVGDVDGEPLLTAARCVRCGHPPCPFCWACGGAWCDTTLDDGDLCCGGRCEFEVEPVFVREDGEVWT